MINPLENVIIFCIVGIVVWFVEFATSFDLSDEGWMNWDELRDKIKKEREEEDEDGGTRH